MASPGMEFVRVFDAADWVDHAACRGMETSWWYPERGEDLTPAKTVCARCPVLAECRAAGRSERYGIWGGQSEVQRKRRRRVDGVPAYFTIRPAR